MANDDNLTSAWSPSKAARVDRLRRLESSPCSSARTSSSCGTRFTRARYLNASPPPTGIDMPTDYTIEINAAPGGTSAPPTDGWVQVGAVSEQHSATPSRARSLSRAPIGCA